MPRPRPRRRVAADLRGASRLLVAATTGTTKIVEQMHRNIAGAPPLGGLIYTSIRTVTRTVGLVLDRALEQLEPVLGDSEPSPERLAAMAALNGLVGDLLAQAENPLAQPMQLRRSGEASARLLVLVHGSVMNDLMWSRHGHNHGAALERDLGYSRVYARYNSGLHISTNGAALAAELEHLVDTWPVKLERLVLLGYSMGGLVVRSACHLAELAGHRWRRKLDALVCLGAPHHGAPLARAGNWLHTALQVSPFSAPLAQLGKLSSAGLTDLRFGYVLDEHWRGRDRFQPAADDRTPLPLPARVRCYAIAASQSAGPSKRPRGDGLVTVSSALGHHADPRLSLAFPVENTRVVYATPHLNLLSRPEVYAALRGWLEKP